MGTPPVGPIAWLVRHGESVWNEAGLVQGQREAPGLTALGLAQAEELGERLADSGAGVVMSSDLRRAIETAQPIARRLGVALVADSQLRERDIGELEGGPSTALVAAVTGYDRGAVVDADARAPGGESLHELYARVSSCLGGYRAAPPAPVFVIVTHGGFLRVARACLEGVAVEAMRPPATPNGVLWRADLGTGELEVVPGRHPD